MRLKKSIWAVEGLPIAAHPHDVEVEDRYSAFRCPLCDTPFLVGSGGYIRYRVSHRDCRYTRQTRTPDKWRYHLPWLRSVRSQSWRRIGLLAELPVTVTYSRYTRRWEFCLGDATPTLSENDRSLIILVTYSVLGYYPPLWVIRKLQHGGKIRFEVPPRLKNEVMADIDVSLRLGTGLQEQARQAATYLERILRKEGE